MDLKEAQLLTRELMNAHGLQDWKFAFLSPKSVFGRCYFDSRAIVLSAPNTALRDVETVRVTILHEIAHALAFLKYGDKARNHGPLWKEVALSLGIEPKICGDGKHWKVATASERVSAKEAKKKYLKG